MHVPPLRERRSDIAPLLREFLSGLSTRHRTTPPRLTRPARARLLEYDWPGNVRELRNVVEMLCLLRSGRDVRVQDLPEALRLHVTASEVAAPTLELALDGDRDGMIHRIVETTLALVGGDTGKAAARLRISSRTIQRYIAAGQVRVSSHA